MESNAHVQGIGEFCTEDATMQENNEPPRVGRELLVANEAKVEELGWQRWRGERIAQEQFFYDPKQIKPVPPAA